MAKLVTLIIPSETETKYFRDVLEMRGFRVSACFGISVLGNEFGIVNRDDRPDLIVVDLQREPETGLKLPSLFSERAELGGIPLLGLVPSWEVQQQATANGYASCLLMPATIADLCAAFRPFIGNGTLVGIGAGGGAYQGISEPS